VLHQLRNVGVGQIAVELDTPSDVKQCAQPSASCESILSQ